MADKLDIRRRKRRRRRSTIRRACRWSWMSHMFKVWGITTSHLICWSRRITQSCSKIKYMELFKSSQKHSHNTSLSTIDTKFILVATNLSLFTSNLLKIKTAWEESIIWSNFRPILLTFLSQICIQFHATHRKQTAEFK